MKISADKVLLILLNVYHENFRIKEVPIVFNGRLHGESKRDLLNFIFSYIKTMHILIKRKRESKRRI